MSPGTLHELPWYALERVPRHLDPCPRCGDQSYVLDDQWGALAGEYVVECISPTCGLRYVGLVIGEGVAS